MCEQGQKSREIRVERRVEERWKAVVLCRNAHWLTSVEPDKKINCVWPFSMTYEPWNKVLTYAAKPKWEDSWPLSTLAISIFPSGFSSRLKNNLPWSSLAEKEGNKIFLLPFKWSDSLKWQEWNLSVWVTEKLNDWPEWKIWNLQWLFKLTVKSLG